MPLPDLVAVSIGAAAELIPVSPAGEHWIAHHVPAAAVGDELGPAKLVDGNVIEKAQQDGLEVWWRVRSRNPVVKRSEIVVEEEEPEE